ncbi:hypothetical protein LZK73_18625 [Neorhizobium galegae]|nr:hypothetical protein LZK73_18625 [Neorhizobium galegae]
MGVSYSLSHHGHRTGDEYAGAEPTSGTWCYYLLIPEQMYPHRWADFACVRGPSGYENPGAAFDHDFFDSEITWSSNEPYFCRKAMRMFDLSKVGCDYAHLWHHERGFPDTYNSVKLDAERTVEKFLAAHPDRNLRSAYSGLWAPADEFYTAINGSLVHHSDQIPTDWPMWLPRSNDQLAGAQ